MVSGDIRARGIRPVAIARGTALVGLCGLYMHLHSIVTVSQWADEKRTSPPEWPMQVVMSGTQGHTEPRACSSNNTIVLVEP